MPIICSTHCLSRPRKLLQPGGHPRHLGWPLWLLKVVQSPPPLLPLLQPPRSRHLHAYLATACCCAIPLSVQAISTMPPVIPLPTGLICRVAPAGQHSSPLRPSRLLLPGPCSHPGVCRRQARPCLLLHGIAAVPQAQYG